MGYICAICSESIEKNPGGLVEVETKNFTSNNDDKLSNLSAAPCGHLFHSYCINKWMNSGIASSKLCPNCRKCIPKNCLALYPDSYDELGGPISPGPVKCEQHEKDIGSLRSKLHTVEADFKIQQALYELLKQDHQQRNAIFLEKDRTKEAEFARFKEEATRSRHQFELDIQKLKLELEIGNHRIEAEKFGRQNDEKKYSDFFQKMASQIQAQHAEVLAFSMQFQRDTINASNEDLKPGPSRLCKPYKSRPVSNFSKPRRGKKMVYEKGTDSDDIEQVDLDESDGEFDILAGPDTRKRKLLTSPRTSTNFEVPKLKMKRSGPKGLSLSIITISSDTDEERDYGVSSGETINTGPRECTNMETDA